MAPEGLADRQAPGIWRPGRTRAPFRSHFPDGGGILAPMRRRGMPRPNRANFSRSAVADREDKIHLRSVRPGEFVPAFRSVSFRGIAQSTENLDRKRVDAALWLATPRQCIEATSTLFPEDALGKDRTGGVARRVGELASRCQPRSERSSGTPMGAAA